MFNKENCKSTRNLEAKKIILHEEFNGFDREIDFCLTTSASPLHHLGNNRQTQSTSKSSIADFEGHALACQEQPVPFF